MRCKGSLVLVMICLAASRASTFVIPDPSIRWPAGEFTIQVDVIHPSLGIGSPSGVTWNAAFAEAADRWNLDSGGLLAVTANTESFEDPCDPADPSEGDGIHGVGFSASMCGTAFGSTTLAVARQIFRSGGLIIEANIIFNESADWDVYTGNLRSAVPDFRRVAVHELGHLFGLGHETRLSAIMSPFTGDLEAPESDDLNGIAALYDLGCPVIVNAGAGSRVASLGVTDCFDTELGLALPELLGLSDGPEMNSFVDLFGVTLSDATTLEVTLSTSEFNPVIQVMDTELANELVSDWKPRDTPVSISEPLAAGSYVVVVRSVFKGSGGSYALELVPEPGSVSLGLAALAALFMIHRQRRSSGFALGVRDRASRRSLNQETD